MTGMKSLQFLPSTYSVESRSGSETAGTFSPPGS